MTVYSLQWRQYQRCFRQPLRTHHGEWAVREGIVVCLQNDDGQMGWGEIAPIPWFGSETIQQAIEYCRSLKEQVTPEQIAAIPNDLPACQFGLTSALEVLQAGATAARSGKPIAAWGKRLECSLLISPEAVLAGAGRLMEWDSSCTSPLNPPRVGDFENERTSFCLQSYSDSRLGSLQNSPLRGQGGVRGASSSEGSSAPSGQSKPSGKTFKCKIGVTDLDREMDQLDRLLKILPAQAKLRLDANGGLSEKAAIAWLNWCDNHPQIEFLEQPLLPASFLQMQQLSHQFQTRIALDESVATIEQLQECFARGWNGIFVIKPAIAGSPVKLRQFCRQHGPDVVWSSALETSIGRRYIEDYLIPQTGLSDRAIGFGVDHWFADDWGQRSAASIWRDLAEVGQ